MNWRLFAMTVIVGGLAVGCGEDKPVEKPSAPQDELATVKVRQEVENSDKVAVEEATEMVAARKAAEMEALAKAEQAKVEEEAARKAAEMEALAKAEQDAKEEKVARKAAEMEALAKAEQDAKEEKAARKAAEMEALAKAQKAIEGGEVAVDAPKVADQEASLTDKVTDYKALISKYVNLDMATVKSEIAKFDANTLNGLGTKITETIKEQSAKISKLTESLKGLSFSDIDKAAEIKEQISDLTSTKDKLTEIYTAVMDQVKKLTGK